MGVKDPPEAEEIIPWEEQNPVYATFVDDTLLRRATGGRAHYHLLSGPCGAEVKNGERAGENCYKTARYRYVGEEGYADRCGHHVTNDLKAAAGDPDREPPFVLNLRRQCEKWVSHESDSERGTDGFPRSHRCSTRAIITVVHPDGTSKALCATHSRGLFLQKLTGN